MRYEDKFIRHQADKHTEQWHELIAVVEFSQGDLDELKKVLDLSRNPWAVELKKDIENSFNQLEKFNSKQQK